MQRTFIRALLAALALSFASRASAQAPAHRWSVDFGLGWDKSISGNINSGAIGTLNGQSVVFLKNTYEDVYGVGLHLGGSVGYMLRDNDEVRLIVTFQSLGADLTRMGDLGVSNLYGQFDDYQSVTWEAGYRRYYPVNPHVRVFGGGSLGLGFIDKTRIDLAAPTINFHQTSDFYDKTTAATISFEGGALLDLNARLGVFAQLGIRYVSGMSQTNALIGAGLDKVDDHSARWAVPFTMGVKVHF